MKNKYLEDFKEKVQKVVEKNPIYKLNKYYLESHFSLPCEHCNQMNLIHITPKEDGLYIIGHKIDFPILNQQELRKLEK